MKSQKAKEKFIELLGKEVVNKISQLNWVEFEKTSEVYNTNEILMSFIDINDDGNEEAYCRICYNIDDKKWFSINCIDYPHKKYDTYEEMVNHLNFIENRILSKNTKVVKLK